MLGKLYICTTISENSSKFAYIYLPLLRANTYGKLEHRVENILSIETIKGEVYQEFCHSGKMLIMPEMHTLKITLT
jgi:hypothetical protein